MGHRVSNAALAAAVMLAAAMPARAKEVRYPAAHPEISLKVPDDWTVAETPLGLELQAPGKDAFVVAGLTGGDRKSVDGWSRRALERMGGEGVVFDKSGSNKAGSAKADKAGSSTAAATKPPAPKLAGADPGKPAAPPQPPAGADAKPDAAADFARMNGDHPYTFGGAPTIEPPKITSELTDSSVGRAGDMDLSSISTEGANPGAMKAAGHFAYTGGSLRGQPVDVELAVFPLGKDRRVLIEQQSGPTDARGVMIVRSMRNLTQ